MKISEYGPAVAAKVEPIKGSYYADYSSQKFTLTTGNYALKFEGLNPSSGHDTALIDQVALNGMLVNGGGFEQPQVNDYAIAPSNSGWDYTGTAGIAGNDNFIGNGPHAPEGSQAAFITNNGSISQTGSVAPETYTLTFKAVQRAIGNGNYEQIRVTMRGAISTKTFVWSGNTIVEERDGTGANVTKRFYAEGEQRVGGDGAGNYYYTRDHLGSIREVTDENGGVIAQYDYDPWGNAVVIKGKLSFDFGFTGHYFHQPSGMNLAMYRAYSPTLGRWISRDPAGEGAGLNLYGYVSNDPVRNLDPLGLCCDSATITKGLAQLESNYSTSAIPWANTILRGFNISPASASCIDKNCFGIYPNMGPIPECWECHLEHRSWFFEYRDHYAVVCSAKNDLGQQVDLRVFDNWKGNTSSTPYWHFRLQYPVEGTVDPELIKHILPPTHAP